jgi:hypothetical protein
MIQCELNCSDRPHSLGTLLSELSRLPTPALTSDTLRCATQHLSVIRVSLSINSTISWNSIKRLVTEIEIQCVFCEEKTEVLNVT